MGTGESEHSFGNTKGAKKESLPYNLQFFASKVFEPGGHVSEKNFEKYGAFFLGKSVKKIAHELNRQGYKVEVVHSIHAKSKAKKIIIKNPSKNRNISSVLVSPGSKRHGGIPYVKVSTTDYGRLKIVNGSKKTYKTDGKERAKIFFRRNQK